MLSLKKKEKAKTLNRLNRELGIMGEESAASFLCGKGFEIIGRNVRLGHLETDIIAKNDTTIVFCEVKTRKTYPSAPHKFGRPAVAVNYDKRDKLIEGARAYLKKYNITNLQPRLDIIEVYISPESDEYKVLKIVHLPNSIRRN